MKYLQLRLRVRTGIPQFFKKQLLAMQDNIFRVDGEGIDDHEVEPDLFSFFFRNVQLGFNLIISSSENSSFLMLSNDPNHKLQIKEEIVELMTNEKNQKNKKLYEHIGSEKVLGGQLMLILISSLRNTADLADVSDSPVKELEHLP
jgi:hypothetical protein